MEKKIQQMCLGELLIKILAVLGALLLDLKHYLAYFLGPNPMLRRPKPSQGCMSAAMSAAQNSAGGEQQLCPNYMALQISQSFRHFSDAINNRITES